MSVLASEINRISEGHVKVLCVSPTRITIDTCVREERQGVEVVKMLLEELRKESLFRNLNVEVRGGN